MQLKKRVLYSIAASAVYFVSSIFVPIVPCRIAPNVPNPIYKWTLCSLNPDQINTLGSIKEYFGYTTVLSESYMITILLAFVITMIFFHYTTRTKRKK